MCFNLLKLVMWKCFAFPGLGASLGPCSGPKVVGYNSPLY